MTQEHKKVSFMLLMRQSPGETKTRELSWTLTKKLETFVSPGEIKRREVVLDPQVSSEDIRSREVELGLKVGLLLRQLFPNGGATDIVFVTLFRTAVGTDSVPHSGWDSDCSVR